MTLGPIIVSYNCIGQMSDVDTNESDIHKLYRTLSDVKKITGLYPGHNTCTVRRIYRCKIPALEISVGPRPAILLSGRRKIRVAGPMVQPFFKVAGLGSPGMASPVC